MAITYTLGGLKAKIADDLARSDLTTQIEDAIATSIKFFQTKRFWFNETRTRTFATVAGQSAYTTADDSDIPDFLDLDAVFLTDSGGTRIRLDPEDPADIHQKLDAGAASGQPVTYAWFDKSFVFHPVPDAAYTITPMGHYILAAPASDSETDNAWMTEGFEMIRSHAKAYLYTHVIKNAPDKRAEMIDATASGKNSLDEATSRKKATGRIRPTQF